MRRITTSLGALAAGALLALAMPAAAANAAEGSLFINGMAQMNPQGCIVSSAMPTALQVTNLTDRIVRVHLLPDCEGAVTTTLFPGMSAMQLGSSVEVLD